MEKAQMPCFSAKKKYNPPFLKEHRITDEAAVTLDSWGYSA